MPVAYLCIGSNVGRREENCKEAIKRLEELDNTRVIEDSRLYITQPVGGPPQEDYLNGVLKIETSISSGDLLKALKNIEKDMGREPSGRNCPRIIDIDILFYDDLVTQTEELTIPHPRLHERHFVLKGLKKIAPELVHPVLGRTVEELYEDCKNDK